MHNHLQTTLIPQGLFHKPNLNAFHVINITIALFLTWALANVLKFMDSPGKKAASSIDKHFSNSYTPKQTLTGGSAQWRDAHVVLRNVRLLKYPYTPAPERFLSVNN